MTFHIVNHNLSGIIKTSSCKWHDSNYGQMIRLDNSNSLCTEIDIVTLCDHAYVILPFFDLSCCCCVFDVLEYYVLEGRTGGGVSVTVHGLKN